MFGSNARKGTYPAPKAPAKPKPTYFYTSYHEDGTVTRTETTKKWSIEQMWEAIGGYVETIPKAPQYYDAFVFPGTLYARSNGVAEGCSRNPHFPGHPHYGIVGPVLRYATSKQEARKGPDA